MVQDLVMTQQTLVMANPQEALIMDNHQEEWIMVQVEEWIMVQVEFHPVLKMFIINVFLIYLVKNKRNKESNGKK